MEENKYGKLLDDSKEYFRMHCDMLRLELLEKLTKIIALILLTVVVLVLLLTAFAYFSFALATWIGTSLDSMEAAYCIVGGIFLLLLAVIYLCRKQLFINPLIRQLSAILLKKTSTIKKDGE